MDTETYEQVALAKDTLEEVVQFMKDNTVVELETFEGEPISVSLPTTVDLEVVWAEMAVAGDTANSPTKEVELETGFRLNVPMFVKEGGHRPYRHTRWSLRYTRAINDRRHMPSDLFSDGRSVIV